MRRYERPTILTTTVAASRILTTDPSKPIGMYQDAVPLEFTNHSAYEADE